MKKTILALLVAVLLVIAIPAAAMAAPAHADCSPKIQTVSATMSVMAVGTSPDYKVAPFAKNMYKVTGTVYYAGTVKKGATPDVVAEGTPITASEKVDYLLDQTGKVFFGMVQGSLAINSVYTDPTVYANPLVPHTYGTMPMGTSYANISFHSVVKGNILSGPASDQGRWDVTQATGALTMLKTADGDWSAQVDKVQIAPGVYTFQGLATVNGLIRNYDRR